MKIGEAIKHIRSEKGLSQKKFSELCDISQSYLSLIENNKKIPNMSTLEFMGKVAGVPLPVVLFLSMNEEDVSEEKRDLFNILSPSISKFIKEIFWNYDKKA